MGFWDSSSGKRKSSRPLSMSVGVRTRGAKFSSSISGIPAVVVAVEPAGHEDARLEAVVEGRDPEPHVGAPAEAVVRQLVLVDVGAGLQVVDGAPDVLHLLDLEIAVGARQPGRRAP